MVNIEWDATDHVGPLVHGICAMPFVPVTDGTFLTDSPLRLVQAGKFRKTDVLLGANQEEGTYFLLYFLTHLFRLENNVSKEKLLFLKTEKFLIFLLVILNNNVNWDRGLGFRTFIP